MKVFFTLILLTGSLIVITSSCSKKEVAELSSNSGDLTSSFIHLDNFNTPGNNINNTYELTQGFTISKGKIDSNDTGYKFQIILSSSEMMLHQSKPDTIDSITGSEFARFIVIDIFSLDSNKITSGNYSYTQGTSGIPSSLTSNFIQINDGITGQNGLIFNNIIEGEVSVIENNGQHEISFSSRHTDWDSNGVIAAYYKDPFFYYNN